MFGPVMSINRFSSGDIPVSLGTNFFLSDVLIEDRVASLFDDEILRVVENRTPRSQKVGRLRQRKSSRTISASAAAVVWDGFEVLEDGLAQIEKLLVFQRFQSLIGTKDLVFHLLQHPA